MDSKEAFKLGFLSRCVEEGLPPAKINSMVKQADYLIKAGILSLFSPVEAGKMAGKATGAAAKNLAIPLIGLTLAAPPTAGALSAYLINKATDEDDLNIADLRNMELANEYANMTARLNAGIKLKQLNKNKKNRGQVYL
jgi:hypothetical protein